MSDAHLSIAVIFGGDSAEREVSIASATQVIAALRSRGHVVRAVDLRDATTASSDAIQGDVSPLTHGNPGVYQGIATGRFDVPALLESLRDVDVAFLALHGGTGEDGTVQTVLDLGGIPYTGSGPAASAVAMDKDLSKRLYAQAGIPTPRWTVIRRGEVVDQERWDYPLVVKPNRQGSTIGLTLVHSSEGLAHAIEHALRYDEEALIEQFVAGREFTVGVLGGVALSVGEIMVSKAGVFDFETKYVAGAVQEVFPAHVESALAELALDYGIRAHRALKLRGYSRTDFRVSDSGQIYCLETNTLPGMTATSLMPQSAAAAGIPFAELCERICRLALD